MVKTNPAVAQRKSDLIVALPEDLVSKISKDVQRDATNMSSWINQRLENYKRRYSETNRAGTGWPWPGASKINMPMSDIHIDEMTAALTNIQFGGNRWVNMDPANSSAILNSRDAGVAMEDLLRYRVSERGQPDYQRQTGYSLDSFLQHGLAIDKIWYSYVTATRKQSVKRSQMPENLQRIQVVKDISPEQQQQLSQQLQIMAVTPQQYDQMRPQIEDLMIVAYQLDRDEKTDSEALSSLMDMHRNGKDDSEVVIRTVQIIEDNPRVANVPIGDMIVPSGTYSLPNAMRITHDTWMHEDQFVQMASDNDWSEKKVDAFLDKAKNRTPRSLQTFETQQLHRQMRERSRTNGVNERDETQIRLSETYFYKTMSVGGRKVPVPMVMQWGRDSMVVLNSQEYDYPHGSWPFVDTGFENNERDYFANRGIPEKIRDLEQHLTALTRSELNALIIQTCPSFTYIKNSGINPQKARWMPGVMWGTKSHNALEPIQMPLTGLALEQPMRNMQQLMERVTGTFLERSVNPDRSRDRVTATEINAQTTRSTSSLGLRARYFIEGRQRVMQQIWALWQHYGPFEFYSKIAGSPMLKLTQQQIAGDFRVQPRWAVEDADPSFKMNQAIQAFGFLQQAMPFLQNDLRYAPDIAQAAKNVFDNMDPHMSEQILRTRNPQEQQQLAQVQQQEMQRQKGIQEEGERLQAGAAVTPEGQLALLRELDKVDPKANITQVIQNAANVRKATIDNALNGSAGNN